MQTLADFAQACDASRANAGQMRLERVARSECGWNAETDDVDGLPVPACRHFDAAQKSNAMGRSGSGRIVESRRGVVIGEGGERHAARRHEFHERRGSEHAVRMATVHMQIGEVGRAHRTV